MNNMKEHLIISHAASMLLVGTMDNKSSKADLARLCAEYFRNEAKDAEKLGITEALNSNNARAEKLEKLAEGFLL